MKQSERIAKLEEEVADLRKQVVNLLALMVQQAARPAVPVVVPVPYMPPAPMGPITPEPWRQTPLPWTLMQAWASTNTVRTLQ